MTAAHTSTWAQVLAWRMRRHRLDPLGPADTTGTVRQLCGVQAQVPSAAALAIALRRDPAAPAGVDVDEALRERQLMRTWAMRGTLHLLDPAEAGAYLALVGAARSWEKPSWQRAFGVSIADMDSLIEAVAAVLDGRTLSREDLVGAVADHLGHHELEEQLRSGWGAVLKPVAWQGLLCQAVPADSAPNRVTFARPDQWLPDWTGVPKPEEAAAVAIPAYLRTYGPATMDAFDGWLTRNNSRKPALRSWFAQLEDELVTVDVEGSEGYLMADDVDDLAATEPSDTVRLLAGFDQYILGPGTAAAEIIPAQHRRDVSRTAGWISPVVVAGGRVVGVWGHSDGAVDVELFDDAEAPAASALDAEVARVEGLLAEDGAG